MIPLSQIWEPWEPIHKKLWGILKSWEDTPYVKGQRAKGAGVDCVRFVCAVLDELYGYERSKGPVWPHDAATHNRAGALAVMRRFLTIYPCFPVRDGTMQPGDVLVCGAPNGGPGHAVIVGPRKNELWHAAEPRVTRVGLVLDQKVFRVFRSEDRDSWL